MKDKKMINLNELIQTLKGFNPQNRYYWLKVVERVYNIPNSLMGYLASQVL